MKKVYNLCSVKIMPVLNQAMAFSSLFYECWYDKRDIFL